MLTPYVMRSDDEFSGFERPMPHIRQPALIERADQRHHQYGISDSRNRYAQSWNDLALLFECLAHLCLFGCLSFQIDQRLPQFTRAFGNLRFQSCLKRA